MQRCCEALLSICKKQDKKKKKKGKGEKGNEEAEELKKN
jgi:hypothetical protein